jgi:hypothetical protein
VRSVLHAELIESRPVTTLVDELEQHQPSLLRGGAHTAVVDPVAQRFLGLDWLAVGEQNGRLVDDRAGARAVELDCIDAAPQDIGVVAEAVVIEVIDRSRGDRLGLLLDYRRPGRGSGHANARGRPCRRVARVSCRPHEVARHFVFDGIDLGRRFLRQRARKVAVGQRVSCGGKAGVDRTAAAVLLGLAQRLADRLDQRLGRRPSRGGARGGRARPILAAAGIVLGIFLEEGEDQDRPM